MTKYINVDLDGVLADFFGAFVSRFGMRPPVYEATYGSDAFWAALRDEGQFFYNLRPTAEAAQIIKIVEEHFVPLGYTPRILTACPKLKEHYPDCEDEKLDWVRLVMGLDWEVVTTRGGVGKQAYAKEGDILADDHKKNIEQWIAKGGIGMWIPENRPSLGIISLIMLAGDIKREQENTEKVLSYYAAPTQTVSDDVMQSLKNVGAVIELTPEQAAKFDAMDKNPPPPNQNLVDAMTRFKGGWEQNTYFTESQIEESRKQ